jgi:hypothetical protein
MEANADPRRLRRLPVEVATMLRRLHLAARQRHRLKHALVPDFRLHIGLLRRAFCVGCRSTPALLIIRLHAHVPHFSTYFKSRPNLRTPSCTVRIQLKQTAKNRPPRTSAVPRKTESNPYAPAKLRQFKQILPVFQPDSVTRIRAANDLGDLDLLIWHPRASTVSNRHNAVSARSLITQRVW